MFSEKVKITRIALSLGNNATNLAFHNRKCKFYWCINIYFPSVPSLPPSTSDAYLNQQVSVQVNHCVAICKCIEQGSGLGEGRVRVSYTQGGELAGKQFYTCLKSHTVEVFLFHFNFINTQKHKKKIKHKNYKNDFFKKQSP